MIVSQFHYEQSTHSRRQNLLNLPFLMEDVSLKCRSGLHVSATGQRLVESFVINVSWIWSNIINSFFGLLVEFSLTLSWKSNNIGDTHVETTSTLIDFRSLVKRQYQLPVVNSMIFTFKRLHEPADVSSQIFGWICISTWFLNSSSSMILSVFVMYESAPNSICCESVINHEGWPRNHCAMSVV